MLDHLADVTLGDWEPLAEAIAEPLSDLVASATSLEQIRDGIAARIAAMDVSATAELLARAGFSARIAGLVDAPLGEEGGT